MRSNLLLGLVASIVVASHSPAAGQLLPQSGSECPVTKPNGIVAGSEQREEWSYGNALLSVGPFGLWPEGTVIFKPGSAGFVTSDGALGMKFGWTRGARGRLVVNGRRLDGAAAPLRSDIPCCYGENGDTGFQASYLIFPTAGCWEVTARVGDHADSTLTFVTKVVKIGDGPARWDPPRRPQ